MIAALALIGWGIVIVAAVLLAALAVLLFRETTPFQTRRYPA